MRQVFVADTDAEALEAARSAHQDWFHSITKLWHANGDHFPDGPIQLGHRYRARDDHPRVTGPGEGADGGLNSPRPAGRGVAS